MSTVCRLFRAAAKAPELWERVDFDTGKIKLDHKKDVLRKVNREFISPVATKYLSFANMRSLKYEELMEVLSKTLALKSLNLASCHGLQPHLIFTGEIKEKCPQLQSLDLSYILKSSNKPGFSKMSNEFLTTHSKGLRYLYLNGVYIYDITKILNAASSWAFSKTLVCLDVSNAEEQFTSRKAIVSLNQFAEATPNLKVFRAQRSSMVFKLDPAFGDLNNHGLWAKLKECNISFPRMSHQRQKHLMGFLSGCIGLRRLNVSHVDGAFRTLVQWESGCRLTHLETSRSAVFEYPEISYNTLTVKELSSHLVKLDLSWNAKQAVGIMLRSLADRSGIEERPLRKLDLAGTSVETGELKEVLEACENLSWINLSSCRSLPCGVKRVHGSREEVEELAKKLRKIK